MATSIASAATRRTIAASTTDEVGNLVVQLVNKLHIHNADDWYSITKSHIKWAGCSKLLSKYQTYDKVHFRLKNSIKMESQKLSKSPKILIFSIIFL